MKIGKCYKSRLFFFTEKPIYHYITDWTSVNRASHAEADLYEILIKIQQFFMDYNLIIISLLSKNVRIRTTNLL